MASLVVHALVSSAVSLGQREYLLEPAIFP